MITSQRSPRRFASNQLGMYRRAGYPWSEIARLMNSSPARLQKRFERAIRRAREQLRS